MPSVSVGDGPLLRSSACDFSTLQALAETRVRINYALQRMTPDQLRRAVDALCSIIEEDDAPTRVVKVVALRLLR